MGCLHCRHRLRNLCVRFFTVALAGFMSLAAPQNRAAEPVAAQHEAEWRGPFAVDKVQLASIGSNRYFILLPGYRLHFQHGKATLTVSVLDATKLVDGVETRVVEEKEETDGRLLEVSRNYFAIDPTTTDVYYFGEDSAEYEDGKVVSREGSWLSGVGGAQFGLMVPGTVTLGDRFYQELAPKVAMDRAEVVAITDEVSTPAGVFKNCLHVKESSPLEKGFSHKHFAAGVGLVQDDEFLLVKIEAPPARAAAPAARLEVVSVAIPGAPPDGLLLDYLAVDHARNRVWIPAGGTGAVCVIDAGTQALTRVENFPTADVERRGKMRKVGPTSATVGDGVVYVGNRADSSVCAVDATTLAKGACVKVPTMPDGVAFVAQTKEVWVTTPKDQSVSILDVAAPMTPKLAGSIHLDGDPEGYAVDNSHGFFYTNLEDKDRTLRIDLATRKVTATWQPECGEAGPRGLVIEPDGRWLMVACPDHMLVLDTAKDGAIVSKLAAGDGVDNFDYSPSNRSLYVAAGGSATIMVLRLDASGALSASASGTTAKGARNAVVTGDGVAYLADGPDGKILIVRPAK